MDLVFDLIKEAAIIAYKVVVKALADDLLKRLKKRTAPTAHRDGSDN